MSRKTHILIIFLKFVNSIEIDTSVVLKPVTHNVFYVDKINGSNKNDGLSEETAVEEIRYAMSKISNGTIVYVKNGTYTNYKYHRDKR